MTERVLISAEEIKNRVAQLAHQIAADYTGELIVAGLLTGSFIFLADLLRNLSGADIDILVDFLVVSSYGSGTETSGSVCISRDMSIDVKGRNVLLVDDILDTGHTLGAVYSHIKVKGPASVKTCVLLEKPSRLRVAAEADYTGFTVPDTFVVGYGLDHNGRFRQLPYITSI